MENTEPSLRDVKFHDHCVKYFGNGGLKQVAVDSCKRRPQEKWLSSTVKPHLSN